MSIRWRLTPAIALTCFLSAAIGYGVELANAADPKVPPEQDPGGPALALIDSGIDYTSGRIAHRLARDGEGEIIGWDFVDNDRTPYAAPLRAPQGGGIAGGVDAHNAGKSAASGASGWDAGVKTSNGTTIAELLLSAYSKGRLIPVRLLPGDAQTLANAIGFAINTPARIIAIAQPLNSEPLKEVVRQASMRFKDHLFVVAGDIAAPAADTSAPANAPKPSLKSLANVVVVLPIGEVDGKPAAEVGAASDLVVLPRAGSMFGDIIGGAPDTGAEAVALAAAAAACQGHGREEPMIGAAAKAALLDASKPLGQAPNVRGLDPMCWYGGKLQ